VGQGGLCFLENQRWDGALQGGEMKACAQQGFVERDAPVGQHALQRGAAAVIVDLLGVEWHVHENGSTGKGLAAAQVEKDHADKDRGPSGGRDNR